jgi:hypothetical protein
VFRYLSSTQGASAVLYCHLLPVVWLYHIFTRYLISGTIFGGKEKVITHKMSVLIFSTTSVLNISHSKKIEEKHYQNFT